MTCHALQLANPTTRRERDEWQNCVIAGPNKKIRDGQCLAVTSSQLEVVSKLPYVLVLRSFATRFLLAFALLVDKGSIYVPKRARTAVPRPLCSSAEVVVIYWSSRNFLFGTAIAQFRLSSASRDRAAG